MPKFSHISLERLNTCHPDLRRIALEAIDVVDFAIVCGHRTDADQQKAYESGHSLKKPGESKHNYSPSRAFDFVPYPVDWSDATRFRTVAHVMATIAYRYDIKIRLGVNFPTFKDLGHIELV